MFASDGGLDMRTFKDAKTIARSLRASLATKGISLSHSECLEIVAQQFGFAEWNILAAALTRLDKEIFDDDRDATGVSLQPPVPTIRVASLAEARPFYVDFLGFVVDWGHEEGSTYAQVTRSGVQLHLNAQSRLNGSSGMLVRMDGIDALHAELSAKQGPFAPSPVSFTPWDSRVFHVIDPFGNAIQFWENNPPGVAKPLEPSR
jgi:catechol 2,3-dioxygenase-like lactoylglutathione lyase family enzyme